MTEKSKLILDANILIRGVIGQAMTILERYSSSCAFLTSEHCAREAKSHLTGLSQKRSMSFQTFNKGFKALFEIVEIVPSDAYEAYKTSALARIRHRDADDWHVVALSLLLDCPIWTEDGDFFGIGIATWQTRNIEIYLDGAKTPRPLADDTGNSF